MRKFLEKMKILPKKDELYSELKKKLSNISTSLEHGLKSARNDNLRQYSLISTAHKQLENIMNCKKELPLQYQRKLQDRIDMFRRRFKDYGFGKEIEMDCFSHENKNDSKMQVTCAGSWRQTQELNRDRDCDKSLENQFQKLNTRCDSCSIDMERQTDYDTHQHTQKVAATSLEQVYLNETTKKYQKKNTDTPKVHSYTDSTVAHTSYQRANEKMANAGSTVTQLDQACQTSLCEEQSKSPPRRTKPQVDNKEHLSSFIDRRMRNSSPKKEVPNYESSSYSMLKSDKQVRGRGNTSYQRTSEMIGQRGLQTSQNRLVKRHLSETQINNERKDSKSYPKSYSLDKMHDTPNLRSVGNKFQSDQKMKSIESNRPTTENNQRRATFVRQQNLPQDETEHIQYFNQSGDNSHLYFQSHEEKMDFQDTKLEREERSKEAERHVKTDSECVSGEAFIEKFQQHFGEDFTKEMVLLEHHKRQLQSQQTRIDETLYKDNSRNFNTRFSGSILEPRGSENEVDSRPHPLSVDDKRIDRLNDVPHAYKKTYLQDSASQDSGNATVSYHRYQHRKSPEIVNVSSYQHYNKRYPEATQSSFKNEHENMGRQQITTSTGTRSHLKDQEYQGQRQHHEMARYTNYSSSQRYQASPGKGDNYNQGYPYKEQHVNQRQHRMQERNYQQHERRSLEGQHSSQGRIFHEGTEMVRRQQLEVAKEVVEDEPLEIIDVHQYFTGDYDLKTLDDSVDIKTQIETVEKWAQTFEDKVNTFSGEKFSLEYFVLDEKLMRLIEHLDKLKCHEDQTTTARKIEVIQYIKRLQSILDSSAKDE